MPWATLFPQPRSGLESLNKAASLQDHTQGIGCCESHTLRVRADAGPSRFAATASAAAAAGHGCAQAGARDHGIQRSVHDVMLNGEPRTIGIGLTLAGLLAELALDPRTVAVERNLEIVPRAEYAACVLEAGDRLEVVTFVGGG